MKIAMLRMDRLINEQYVDGSGGSGSGSGRVIKPELLIQIHDELIYDVPTSITGGVVGFAKKLSEVMTSVGPGLGIISVPMKVKMQSGLNWGGLSSLVI